MPQGVVIRAYNGYHYVRTDASVFECKTRGKMKKQREKVYVGDYVEFEDLGQEKGIIEKILPRKTLLERPTIANISQVFLMFAIKDPDVNLKLLNRFLILAEHSDIPIVICLNKVELAEEEANRIAEEYRAIGYTVLLLSAHEERNIDMLKTALADKITVFAGPSGVGKSSLLNLVEPTFKLATGSVSEKIGRGKHTTRFAQLLPLSGGGYVVDTPGFSYTEFEMEETVLASCFPEFRPYEQCRFSPCLHSHEPSCGVKEAVERGDIKQQRYQSYLEILAEIQEANKKKY